MSPVLITGSEPGGQLMTTTDVDNWPGGREGLLGPQLMDELREHAERLGTEVIYDHIDEVDLSRRPFTLKGGLDAYRAESLIIATGATARYLGLESEQNYLGKGVSACATCDGFFFRDRPVVVVGGGNTAVEEALYLSNICSSVTLIHRRDALRAEKMMQQQLFERAGDDGPIDIRWDRVLEQVLGDGDQVTGVKIRSTKEEGLIEDLKVDGVFIAIGHDPATSLFVDSLEHKDGYLIQPPAARPAVALEVALRETSGAPPWRPTQPSSEPAPPPEAAPFHGARSYSAPVPTSSAKPGSRDSARALASAMSTRL